MRIVLVLLLVLAGCDGDKDAEIVRLRARVDGVTAERDALRAKAAPKVEALGTGCNKTIQDIVLERIADQVRDHGEDFIRELGIPDHAKLTPMEIAALARKTMFARYGKSGAREGLRKLFGAEEGSAIFFETYLVMF
ncbi:MAG: hypothetical protein ABI445_24185 [Polyangia bacterium]